MKITRMKPISRAGFTLVEMLVVILVIAVLAGMILFSARKVGENNARAKTVQAVETLRAAVEEFYAEYGQYPPVPSYPGVNQPIYYEFYSVNTVKNENSLTTPGDWSKGPIFTFGLMSYLIPRWGEVTNVQNQCTADGLDNGAGLVNGGQWATNNDYIDNQQHWGDQLRDLNARKRWKPFVDQVISGPWPRSEMNGAYTNWVKTVLDGWGRDLFYHSDPPYQSYDIWSAGPDGASGGWLGHITDAKAAVDDIHSGAGH